ARAFRPPPCVVVDGRDGDCSAIGIDANGATAIFEGVLSLCGGARQQKRGDGQQLLHLQPPEQIRVQRRTLGFGALRERDLDHSQWLVRKLAGLVQRGVSVNLNADFCSGQFTDLRVFCGRTERGDQTTCPSQCTNRRSAFSRRFSQIYRACWIVQRPTPKRGR